MDKHTTVSRKLTKNPYLCRCATLYQTPIAMEAVKDIPYGLSNFEQARKQNAYYVDKTMYLPMLEQTANYRG